MTVMVTTAGYTVDGKFYRRVSSLLKEYGIIPPYATAGNAMEFGTHVHLACEYLDHNTLDFGTLDPALKPYVEQYKLFRSAHNMETMTHIEHLFVSNTYGYAGTVDRIIDNNIYDIKTGAPADWHGVQLALYKILARENQVNVKKCYALYLTDHDYKVQDYNEQFYRTVAMGILNIKNYKER
jgi:hypothetical protein